MDKLSSSVKNKKTTLKIKGALALWLLVSSPPVPEEEGLPVAFITDLLAALGENLPLLLVGCAEILLAVYLIGKLLWGEVQHKPSGKEYFLLENSTTPGVLIECGFISNAEELAKLKDNSYQQQLALCIYQGLCTYLEQSSQWQESR